MKHHHFDDSFDFDSDDLSPVLSPRIEHMSRKWAEEEEDRRRHQRRALTRRRIEDWREERSIRRQFDDLDAD